MEDNYIFFDLKKITSLQNSFIKSLILLKEKSRVRQKDGFFLIEGKREISLAFKAGYVIDKILFFPKICLVDEVKEYSEGSELIEINKQIFEKLAYRKTTDGIIGVAKCREHDLTNLELTDNPLILIAESPEKPGNIGALLRTADAANLDAVIIANPRTDLYNPNIIRSSIGGLFTNQIAIANTEQVICFLKQRKIKIYCATLQNTSSYDTHNYKGPTAIVVGDEANGLSEDWGEVASQNIIIPMQGKIDSMNVSVAAGVLIFEAKRQRGF